jgi:2'-5' RNA ligase
VTQSVELLLDVESDAAVRTEWQALSAAGLPTEQRTSSDSHRPHITLFAGDTLAPDSDLRLPGLVAGLDLHLRLGGLMLFGPHRDRFVLVHQVVPSIALLQLQQRVAEVCGGSDSYFAPGEWTAHVTLARRLGRAQIPEALGALLPCSAVGHPLRVSRCRRWDSDGRRTWLL